jgi:hypothetical protein
MEKKLAVKCVSVLSLLAAVLVAPTAAYAQSGSRLCGWTAQTPNGQVIGLLYEVRTADVNHDMQCNKAISEFKDSINKDAKLSKMSWTKVEKATCESIGSHFKSTSKPSDDMCDYMGASDPYQVVKESAANTVYTKLHK